MSIVYKIRCKSKHKDRNKHDTYFGFSFTFCRKDTLPGTRTARNHRFLMQEQLPVNIFLARREYLFTAFAGLPKPRSTAMKSLLQGLKRK